MAKAKMGVLGKVLRLLVAKRVVVRGLSMCPTLLPGEYVLFDRCAYWRASPDRGDVVLAAHPSHRRFHIIKRVLGLPGDTVENCGGKLLINAEPWGSQQDISTFTEGRWLLEEGQYFLVGDEPSRSTDSRQMGPFPRGHIRARAWLVYWPLSRWRILHRWA